MKRKRVSAGSAPTKKQATVAKKVVNQPLANQISTRPRYMAPEKKNVDLNQLIASGGGVTLGNGTPVWSAPGVNTLLNGLSTGSLATNRIGRKVCWTKFSMNWTVTLAPTSIGGGQVRFRVLFDKQSNTAAPLITDVFNLSDFHSANNLANEDRFITIADEITEPISVANNFSVSGKTNRKIDLETIYNQGTTGTIADIQSGAIYILIAQNGQITTLPPIFEFYSRLRFLDH